MKLYWSDTVNPRKACAVAKYLKSPVEFVHVDLGRGEHKRPEYLALNPNGKVPTLVDGPRTLWEANAIMCHLAARADSDLWPQDDRQIEVIRWLSWDLAHFYRAGSSLYFEYIIKPRFGLGDVDFAVASVLPYAERASLPLDEFPNVRRWHDRLNELDAWRDPYPALAEAA